jgi:XTP/dITP diphosphohydrolase
MSSASAWTEGELPTDDRLRVVVASANPDKAREIAEAFFVPWVELVPRPTSIADVVEDGDTLEDNARLKATAVANATGLVALADDTGLEVRALDGAPGVVTARYAGDSATYEDNVRKLLKELEGVEDRVARFRTVVVLRWPDGAELVCGGEVYGTIATEARGDNGFGYDPVFEPIEANGKTFAELGSAEKNSCSHRARALAALAEQLQALPQ